MTIQSGKRVFAVAFAVVMSTALANAGEGPSGPRGGGGPPWARGGQGPRPFMLFHLFDDDQDGALTEEEVPARVWQRLSTADLDGDGAVTRREIMEHLGLTRGAKDQPSDKPTERPAEKSRGK